MLESLERAEKATNHTIRDRIPRGSLHVYLLTQIAIEKDILDVKLRDRLLSNRGHIKESANSGYMGDGREGLIVITTILLLKTTGHKMSLVAVKRAIRASLDLVHLLARDRSDKRR